MRLLFAIAAAAIGVGCGDAADTLAIVDIDTTQLVPSPQTLYLTLTNPNGEVIAHSSAVAADGVTRVELVASSNVPVDETLQVTAYIERDIVAQSEPLSFTFAKEATVSLSVIMTPP